MRGARHRVGRLAAGGHAGPWQVLRRIAEHDVALLPRHVEHLGGHAVDVKGRMRAEIAYPRLELDPSIGLDDEQRVEADRAAGKRADGDADPARLGALSFA